jgi:hypothetical protein
MTSGRCGSLGLLLVATAGVAGCANTVVTSDAQQAERATRSPPAPMPSAPPSAVSPAAPARAPLPAPERAELNASTVTVDTLLDEPHGREVLARFAPAIAASGQLRSLRGRTLAQVAGNPESGLTAALVQQIVAALNAP